MSSYYVPETSRTSAHLLLQLHRAMGAVSSPFSQEETEAQVAGTVSLGSHSQPAAVLLPRLPSLGAFLFSPQIHPSSSHARSTPASEFSPEARLPTITGRNFSLSTSVSMSFAHPGLFFSVTNKFGTLGLKRLKTDKGVFCSDSNRSPPQPARSVQS